MCKRKLGEKLFNIKGQLHLAMKDGTSAEMAVLYLMDDFDFDLEEVKASLMSMNDERPYSLALEWMLTHSQKRD